MNGNSILKIKHDKRLFHAKRKEINYCSLDNFPDLNSLRTKGFSLKIELVIQSKDTKRMNKMNITIDLTQLLV